MHFAILDALVSCAAVVAFHGNYTFIAFDRCITLLVYIPKIDFVYNIMVIMKNSMYVCIL